MWERGHGESGSLIDWQAADSFRVRGRLGGQRAATVESTTTDDAALTLAAGPVDEFRHRTQKVVGRWSLSLQLAQIKSPKHLLHRTRAQPATAIKLIERTQRSQEPLEGQQETVH